MDSSPTARFSRALNSLEGLSVGDAYGEQFFPLNILRAATNKTEFIGRNKRELDAMVSTHVKERREPVATQWEWTDDTAMALEVVAELHDNGKINPDSLARRFARRYAFEPTRGYGMAMYSLLPQLEHESWRVVAPRLFDGKGSYGNGSAMRVPPLGAYFADDFDLLIEQAQLSAIVTHSHEEAVAGAIATAVATGICTRLREERTDLAPADFLSEIIAHTPDSQVKRRLVQCRDLSESYTSQQVASLVGSGIDVACHDTVPFCCWCAATQSNNFAEAMWRTVAGLGDRDTTCAIVGGIVGARVGKEAIPAQWHARREPLPQIRLLEGTKNELLL